MDILKGTIDSYFLTGMISHYYYEHIWVAEMMLKYESVLDLMKSLIGDDVEPKNYAPFISMISGCTTGTRRSCQLSSERQTNS